MAVRLGEQLRDRRPRKRVSRPSPAGRSVPRVRRSTGGTDSIVTIQRANEGLRGERGSAGRFAVCSPQQQYSSAGFYVGTLASQGIDGKAFAGTTGKLDVSALRSFAVVILSRAADSVGHTSDFRHTHVKPSVRVGLRMPRVCEPTQCTKARRHVERGSGLKITDDLVRWPDSVCQCIGGASTAAPFERAPDSRDTHGSKPNRRLLAGHRCVGSASPVLRDHPAANVLRSDPLCDPGLREGRGVGAIEADVGMAPCKP